VKGRGKFRSPVRGKKKQAEHEDYENFVGGRRIYGKRYKVKKARNNFWGTEIQSSVGASRMRQTKNVEEGEALDLY